MTINAIASNFAVTFASKRTKRDALKLPATIDIPKELKISANHLINASSERDPIPKVVNKALEIGEKGKKALEAAICMTRRAIEASDRKYFLLPAKTRGPNPAANLVARQDVLRTAYLKAGYVYDKTPELNDKVERLMWAYDTRDPLNSVLARLKAMGKDGKPALERAIAVTKQAIKDSTADYFATPRRMRPQYSPAGPLEQRQATFRKAFEQAGYASIA